MPGIRHRRGKPAPVRRAGFGRGGWVVIGASGIALGAAFHAVAGIAEIARELIRREPRSAAPEGGAPTAVAPARPHEAAGWVLIVAAAVVVSGLSHAVANLAELAREILRRKPASPAPVRTN
ncbi:hypothetical protein MTF65_04175 [Streptomyces sp. APSN-46.1]|uniref:hypothetical protein n=1 Tax=Streptomyces sp. APSN-46.1 TaxID=2929049 RepID=UPI001FB3713C|nr:hypothetical protein [Streptomyces sp. APSN-46.1]MCJ1676558.1 hypothetical protein [Streptomyces sp. APSN-46.1]